MTSRAVSPSLVEESTETPCPCDHPRLKSEFSSNGVLEIHSVLPDGISIGHGPFGRCLTADKDFPKGSLLYQGQALLVTDFHNAGNSAEVENHDANANSSPCSLSLKSSSRKSSTEQNVFVLHLYRINNNLPKWIESCKLDNLNSVQDFWNPGEISRQVYGFDGFMNHSCSPNCYCPLVSRTPELMTYDSYALKDIQTGDEITCDYALFDYECDGHQITECGCMAPNCRGIMMGFKALPLKEKVKIMQFCEEEILEQWFNHENVVVIESQLPEGVEIVLTDESMQSFSLTATRRFAVGEIVYTNESFIIENKENFAESIYILRANDNYILIDHNDHFIHRPEYKEFLGFDSFQDHSCDPNTCQTYHDKTNYTVIAKKQILPGERITMDYAKLKNQATNIEHVPSSTFTCHCGEAICRGVISA